MSNEELVKQIRAGIDTADHMLILYQQNIGMIEKLAGRYSSMAEKEDLMQEGYIGLCNAVNHWDPDGGAKFLTYAVFWIRQRMQRYVGDCWSVVRIPVNEQQKQREYQKVKAAFEAQNGRKPTNEELCHHLGVEDRTLVRIQERSVMGRIASLDECIGEEEDTPLSDMIPGQQDVEGSVLDQMQQEELKAVIWSLVDSLPEQQGDIIRMRYQEGKTLEETGERIGLSLISVRRQERKGMQELRKPSRSWQLRPFLYDDITYNTGMQGVGVRRFHETWTSVTERVALRALDGSRT